MSGPPQGVSPWQINLHQLGNTIVWAVLFDVAVICLQFKHKPNFYLAHVALTISMFALYFIVVSQLLFTYGFNIVPEQNGVMMFIHGLGGLSLFGLFVLQICSGLYARYSQESAEATSQRVLRLKMYHRVMGLAMGVLYKIDVFWSWGVGSALFYILVVWESVFLGMLIHFKVYLQRMERVPTDLQVTVRPRIITAIGEISKQYPEYAIFADNVYDISSLRKLHPGGFEIIKTVIGREVDRFIYGMYGPELLPSIAPHSHSAKSMELVGPPIAKYHTPNPFEGFHSEVIGVKALFMQLVAENVYLLGMVPSDMGKLFLFKGYSSVGQLGQYYSLTVDNRYTRLYTSVNLLSSQNLALMGQIFPETDLKYSSQGRRLSTTQTQQMVNLESMLANTDRIYDEGDKPAPGSNYLPLMIKVYSNGKATSLLKDTIFSAQLRLSQPRGRGLELHSLKPGKIVILAGGTGLFPFLDFIDLLFKSTLLAQSHKYSEQILKCNPILQQKPFQGISVHLMLAVAKAEDIHPLALQQIIELCKHTTIFTALMRISDKESTLPKMGTGISFTREYFGKLVLEAAKKPNVQKVWICGPPKLNSETALSLLNNGFTHDDFLLI